MTRILMLGKGWFPDQLGGLDRMYRELFESLRSEMTGGVVIGPVQEPPPELEVVSQEDASLIRRWIGYWRAVEARSEHYQVIDAHFALYAFPLTLLGRTKRQPWVVHFQGPWAGEAMVQGDGSRFRYLVRRGIERRVYARADRILVLSSAFRQELVSRYRLSPWNVQVIPPGVNLEKFSPPGGAGGPSSPLDVGSFTAVCARRLVPRMGIDGLLEAWQIAIEEGLPESSRLYIAGDGPLFDALNARISELGIDGSAQLLGKISDERLIELYRGADVNVVPTLAQEGFGLVVLESAACGTPSIVTSVGGLPEAVSGLDRSLIVEPGEPRELARRLIDAAEGGIPDRGATRAFAERFSWAKMAGRRQEIYQQAAGRVPDQRLKVVYLDHVAELSGGEVAMLRLVAGLKEINAHVLLFENGPLAARLREAGISVEVLAMDHRVAEIRRKSVLRSLTRPRLAFSAAAHTFRVARRLRQLRPDLVHSNSLKAGVIGSLAARIAGVPLVWHLHDRLAADYLPRPLATLMRWWIGVFATQVIANSKNTAEALGDRSNGRPRGSLGKRVSVIPPVIEPRHIASPRPEPDAFTAGMIGRLAPWKGQDVFLRGFAKAFPDGPERAVIVGSAMFGEDGYAEELHGLACDLGIADRVEWTGFVDDVAKEIQRFDVLVHASRIPEPFGQVVLDAFAGRVAMIAADAGGPREMIEHNRDGLLYPPGDALALAAMLRRCREDDSLRERISRAGHERLESFSPSAINPKVMRVYGAALGRP